jgi:hypothetical protein
MNSVKEGGTHSGLCLDSLRSQTHLRAAGETYDGALRHRDLWGDSCSAAIPNPKEEK